MKKFIKPEMTLCKLPLKDVITSSGEQPQPPQTNKFTDVSSGGRQQTPFFKFFD